MHFSIELITSLAKFILGTFLVRLFFTRNKCYITPYTFVNFVSTAWKCRGMCNWYLYIWITFQKLSTNSTSFKKFGIHLALVSLRLFHLRISLFASVIMVQINALFSKSEEVRILVFVFSLDFRIPFSWLLSFVSIVKTT